MYGDDEDDDDDDDIMEIREVCPSKKSTSTIIDLTNSDTTKTRSVDQKVFDGLEMLITHEKQENRKLLNLLAAQQKQLDTLKQVQAELSETKRSLASSLQTSQAISNELFLLSRKEDTPNSRCTQNHLECKICYSRVPCKRLAPCGHVLCEVCLASSQQMHGKQCPFCRKTFLRSQNIYFS